MCRSLYRFLIVILCTAVLFGGTGCAYRYQEDPKEIFQRALTGLAGKEEMRFRGKAAIRTDDHGLFDTEYQYSGTLTNHNKMVVESQLSPSSPDTKTRSLTLKRANKEWKVETLDGTKPAVVRWNPLAQLEAIEQINNKTLRAEPGVPRGKQMIRIELEGEEAVMYLSNQLEEEMQELRSELPVLTSSVPDDKRSECLKELNTLYQQQKSKLDDYLTKAQATLVYHLLIDKKTNLPLRLSSESEIRYQKAEGAAKELLVTDVYFDHYK
ncbi:hypothetical protein [Paenibacillus sp. Marseille-Q7038]